MNQPLTEMTINNYILPMTKNTKPRRIIFFIYNGFELLDFSGPASVYANANKIIKTVPYGIIPISTSGGLIKSSAGVEVNSIASSEVNLKKNDTLLVVGADQLSLEKAVKDKKALTWIKKAAKKCQRFGSICSGTVFLGLAGLINNRTVTTHWEACNKLKEICPQSIVNENSLYEIDENLWTSAGVSTGIDMALQMLSVDHNEDVKALVAKRLVVYAHRPGNQSQFSSMLKAQTAHAGMFSDIINWIYNNLDKSIKVSDLALLANMSERSFYRKFTKTIGKTPSKYIEIARLEKAKFLLEANHPVKAILSNIGYSSEASFRQAFKKLYGVSPSLHSQVH